MGVLTKTYDIVFAVAAAKPDWELES